MRREHDCLKNAKVFTHFDTFPLHFNSRMGARRIKAGHFLKCAIHSFKWKRDLQETQVCTLANLEYNVNRVTLGGLPTSMRTLHGYLELAR